MNWIENDANFFCKHNNRNVYLLYESHLDIQNHNNNIGAISINSVKSFNLLVGVCTFYE